MNDDVLEAVQGALSRRIAAGEMFTAWDITRELRENLGLPHGLLKQVIHVLYADCRLGPEYIRTLCDVGGERGPAWVYHRYKDNPEHYVTDGLLERLLS